MVVDSHRRLVSPGYSSCCALNNQAIEKKIKVGKPEVGKLEETDEGK